MAIGEVEGKRFPHPVEDPLLEATHPAEETAATNGEAASTTNEPAAPHETVTDQTSTS